MDEFISLFEERLCVLETGLESGKVICLKFADKPLRIRELAANLPPALGVIEGLRRGEHAEKFIDLSLCIGGVERDKSKWSNDIALKASVHVGDA